MTAGTEVTLRLNGTVCVVQARGQYGQVDVHGTLTHRLMDALQDWRDTTYPALLLWVREAPVKH